MENKNTYTMTISGTNNLNEIAMVLAPKSYIPRYDVFRHFCIFCKQQLDIKMALNHMQTEHQLTIQKKGGWY